MQKRTTAAVLLTALALSLPAGPALAGDRASAAPRGAVAADSAADTGTTTSPKAESPKAKAPKAKAPKAKAPKAPKVKPVRMTLNGTVTAVADGTLTFTVKNGSGKDKSLRGKPLTVAVPQTARVTRDDEAATLADVAVGDRVNVHLVKAGDTVTATRVNASSVEAPAEPEPAPAPAPTEPAPAPEPAPAS